MKRTFYTRIIRGSLIIVVILLVVGCALWYRRDTRAGDPATIQEVADAYHPVFESGRGFGNDRFDVYSFSLKTSAASQLVSSKWKVYDQEFEMCYTRQFQTLLDVHGSDIRLSKVRAKIEEIRRADDLRYRRIDRGSTTMLYMYSAAVDLGYCLILTI